MQNVYVLILSAMHFIYYTFSIVCVRLVFEVEFCVHGIYTEI